MVDRNSKHTFEVTAEDAGERIDRYLTAQLDDVSRAQVQRAVDAGAVIVDGVVVRSSYKVLAGDSIDITMIRPEDPNTVPEAEDIALEVVHEDDAIIVINKPAGMVVHPAVGHRTGTIVNALLGRGLLQDSSGPPDRPGIVHRLDKGTSGLLVCAKTESAHRSLGNQLRDRTLHRTYLTVAWGRLRRSEMIYDGAIGRSNVDRKKMTVTERGRGAKTCARLLERYDLADYLEVKLETGRTHQIRVHLNNDGHPVVGDTDYGGGLSRLKGVDPAKRLFGRQMLKTIARPALHAKRLSLDHPTTGKREEFEAPIPDDFAALLDLCRKSH